MKKIFVFVFIFSLAFLVTKSLWQVQWYPMHDTTHLARTYLMEKTIKAGQIPPLWADKVNQTLGYPLFHFYAPLVYYLATFIHQLIPSYFLTFKLVIFFFTFVGGAGIYQLLKSWGNWEALLASAAFLLIPYGAVDLYVRGAFAEYAAMMLLPWLFYVWQRPQKGKHIFLTAIVTALFVLSHNLIPLITFPAFVVWTLYWHRSNLKSLIYPAVLFLLLTSYFLLPLFFERSFVQVDKIARTTNFHLHFLEPWQIWNSTWGFGGSAPGVEDGMSFKLGKLQILLALIGLFYLLKSKRLRSLGFVLASIGFFAFWMTTKFSLPLWNATKYLAMIQFPWRYLSLLGFSLAILAAFSLKWLPVVFRLPGLFLITLSLIFFDLKYFQPQKNLSLPEKTFFNQTYLVHNLAPTIPEYLPTWLPSFPQSSPSSLITSINLNYQLVSHSFNHYQLVFNLSQPTVIIIHKAYYPTWQATLDNKTIRLQPTKAGLIQAFLPQGQHTLILFQSHTLLEKLSFYLSLLTLFYISFKLLTKN